MGNGPNNIKFQEESQCEVFFKEGFSKSITLISLFNIFGNIYKLKNKTNEVKLTQEQKDIIDPAMKHIINEYIKDNNFEDIKSLENGIISIKNMMSIVSFYRIKNKDISNNFYMEKVEIMFDLIKEVNQILSSKLRVIKLN